MITFSKLVRLAPFDEETRKEILAKEATMSEDQKREITELAWDMVTAEYQANADAQIDLEFEKLREENKPFSEEVNTAVHLQMDMDFDKKLEAADTSEQIEKVQEELKTHE